jgi:hypothetical protein
MAGEINTLTPEEKPLKPSGEWNYSMISAKGKNPAQCRGVKCLRNFFGG